MELKYKVYDKTTDTMYSSDEIRMRIDLTSQMIKIKDDWLDSENEIEAIILPPTGVKDINKKDSYLGNILKEPINSRKKEREKKSFGIVKKERNSNNLYLEWNYIKLFEGEEVWLTNNLPITHIDRYEIVGSIYTNPDMIKKEG